MLAHAHAELPAECCGLMAGHPPDASNRPPTASVEVRYPLLNRLLSPTEYESDPKSMFAAKRDWEARGIDVVAVYHSHPSSAPIPSRKDLERNYSEQVINFIISFAGPVPEIRGWWLRETDYEPADWEVV
jgi:[CysO sulfur-carrier protein]-S-L-cysteine hydrolase